MENVCAVPGELVDHITRGKEPWRSALSLDRKLGTLLQKHLRHHLIGGESVEAGVQPQRREKKTPGRKPSDLPKEPAQDAGPAQGPVCHH